MTCISERKHFQIALKIQFKKHQRLLKKPKTHLESYEKNPDIILKRNTRLLTAQPTQ